MIGTVQTVTSCGGASFVVPTGALNDLLGFEGVEPELRAGASVADESVWERIKREVREGFTGARAR